MNAATVGKDKAWFNTWIYLKWEIARYFTQGKKVLIALQRGPQA